MDKEFKSFFKTVDGNEGNKCNYNTRLDTYGCGCQHDCSYCYAKSLLNFRRLWHPKNPSIVDKKSIVKAIASLPKNCKPIRLGGMTDCFQPMEKIYKRTLLAIHCLNRRRIPYLIVTKSDLVADDEYLKVLDKDLAHVQITLTCTDDDLYKKLAFEKAPVPSRRIAAIEKLTAAGIDTQVRLSPYIPEFIDLDILSGIRCDKLLVEFLRVNSWIEKWFNIDFSDYIISHGGYKHLPLQKKIDMINKIHGFKEISVCEDEDEAYEYWKNNFNPNIEDCCNLRR